MNFINRIRKQTYKANQRKTMMAYKCALKNIKKQSKKGKYETYYYYDGLFQNEVYICIKDRLINKGFEVEIIDTRHDKELLISWN